MGSVLTCLLALMLLVLSSPPAALGGEAGIETVNRLLKGLKSSDYQEAWRAARELSKFPQYRTHTVPALIQALNYQWGNCSGDIRDALARSLTELKAREAVFPLLDLLRSGKSVEHECAECGCCFLALTPGDVMGSRGFDPFCANSVLWAIHELADFSHSKAMADLVSDGKWRPELLLTLGKVGLPRYAHFISRYKDDKDDAVRMAVARALGLIKNDEVTVPVLLQLLSRTGEDFQVKWEASNSLITIARGKPKKNLKKPLTDLLGERDKLGVLLAARALAVLREEQGVRKLRDMTTDGDANVRSEAVMYLGEVSDAASKDIVSERLKDESLQVRAAAMFALGRIADPSIIPILQSAFERSNDYQQELEKRLKSGGGGGEKEFREKYGLGLFDLRQTLQEAIEAVQKKGRAITVPKN